MNVVIYLSSIMGFDLWVIVLALAVLLFGGSKIPELMRGVGRGMGELQKGLQEGKQHLEDSMKEVTKAPESPATPADKTDTATAPDTTVRSEEAQPRS